MSYWLIVLINLEKSCDQKRENLNKNKDISRF
jgi:hypothetical protein